jgi:hypothetical protein
MDIQETAKKLMEGAEQMATSAATKPKFTHSAKGGKHKDSEGLEGSTQGMPSDEKGKNTFDANVSAKEGQRPTDEKMPGKTAGKLRKQSATVDPKSEIETEIDYLAPNPGKEAAKKIGKTTKLTQESEEVDDEVIYEEETVEEISMDHHLEALFNGQELSEDFKARTATIFEAAVNERVESIREQLETKVEAKLAAAIEENKEEMATNLDSYLNYVVEGWMKENEVAIERGLRNEVTEEFLSGLRNLFLEHNIDVPESKVDVLEKMAARIEELEESLNKEIENNISLREKVEVATKRDVVEEIGSDLTATERVKLRKLLEGVTAESHADFITKAKILKENYFAEGIEPIRNTEEGIEDLQPNYLSESNDTMGEYLKALNRMGRK